MTHHKRTRIESGSSTASGASLSPLTTFVAGRQKSHRLREILLNLIKNFIVRIVGTIKSIKRRIIFIVCDNRRCLIITCKIIIAQAANKESLSLDTLHLFAKCSIIISSTRENKVTYIYSIIPFTPYPCTNIISGWNCEIVERKIPYL